MINKKIFIFENDLAGDNNSIITIKGPALNFNKYNFLKPPKLIKRIKVNQKRLLTVLSYEY